MGESQVLHRAFYSPALGREKRYCIYLPSSYAARQDLRFSTVYLLPGLMDYERTWIDKGRVHEHMDELIAQGRIGEMILVMPDKDDAALDETREDTFATYLAQDLIGHIDATFRTIGVRHHRALEGLSLGAGWAMRMALYRPDLYCSIGCLSGGFDEEIHALVLQRKEHLRRSGMRFRIGVGTGEQEIIEGNEEFARFLRSQGFYCEYELADGPHDWPLWVKQIRNSLQFHYYSFNPR